MTIPEATLQRILDHEGGWRLINDPDDPGGETYAGISRRANPDWPGWDWIAKHGPAAAKDGGTLERLVRERYQARYWSPLRLDEVFDGQLALQIFSAAVVTGPVHAVRIVQRAADVNDDGLMGPVTLDALNSTRISSTATGQLRSDVALELISFFSELVRSRPPRAKYLRGWINRALIDAGRMPA